MTRSQTDQPAPLDHIDLTACEQEPIRIPGTIQPHGVLLVLEPGELKLLQASVNADILFAGGVNAALGKPLARCWDDVDPALLDDLEQRVPENGIAHLRQIRANERSFSAIAHRAGESVILELESAERESGSLDALYPRIRAFVDDLDGIPSTEELCAAAASQVRRITGFDRVMVYRFDDQWNGTVVAEDRNDRLPSYLDLRFPASDIPAQARELYRLNRLRLIPNAVYRPVPIVPTDNPQTAAPTDLSFSVLRSVSPVHLEYMQNMGTPASMSISVVVEGALWGLISCHHAEPLRVPIHVRTACDFLAQVVAMQVAARSRSIEAAERVERQRIQTKLLAFMAAEEQFIHGLTGHADELLSLADAAGAAVVFDGACTLLGETPDEAAVQAIVAWLSEAPDHDDVFHTDSLVTEMPDAEAFAEAASGLLAISISQLHPSYVLWFRPETIRTVTWGGDPRKPAQPEPGATRLHPRTSFEMWKETVRLRSRPWTRAEIDTADTLRNAIVGIVMRKAEELAQLTDELRRSNKELEAFSYSVSHDLRAPFRHIVGYAELLRESDAIQSNERNRRYVETIIDSAFSAGRLVDDLLGFSQMGRATLMPVRVDMDRLVGEVRRILRPETKNRKIEWRIGDLDPTWGDPSMLRQVVQNLLSNAIKYTGRRDEAVIEVRSERTPEETIYSVSDNGVGFDMAYVDKLFGVFQRLHRMEDFEGTGIGLANVRRILERHGGRTWAEGKVDKGATFYFALPHQARE